MVVSFHEGWVYRAWSMSPGLYALTYLVVEGVLRRDQEARWKVAESLG